MTENTKPTETGGENDSESKDGAQRILDFGAAITRTPHGNVYCLTIIGQIEGHTTAPNTAKTTKYEHVLPLLAKLEESDEVDGVLFLLNTVGGDVEAGLRRTTTSNGSRSASWPLWQGTVASVQRNFRR